jgi:hypothetical protein
MEHKYFSKQQQQKNCSEYKKKFNAHKWMFFKKNCAGPDRTSELENMRHQIIIGKYLDNFAENGKKPYKFSSHQETERVSL